METDRRDQKVKRVCVLREDKQTNNYVSRQPGRSNPQPCVCVCVTWTQTERNERYEGGGKEFHRKNW